MDTNSPFNPSPQKPVSAPPDIAAINEEFLWCVNRREANVFRRHSIATRARNCWWPGQTEDGKKWWKLKNEDDVFPWPGAADTRVHLVDSYVREDVATLMTVWRRNKVMVSGTESNDEAFGNRLTNVLRWMKYTRMKEAKREVRLLANWMVERGTAVCGVFWDRKTRLGYDVIDLENIKANAMQAQQAMARGLDSIVLGLPNELIADLPAIIMDPTRDEEAFVVAEHLYPDASAASLRTCLKELRKTGVSKLARAYTLVDQPRITAFATNQDIFIPPEANGLQESSGIFWRELLTDVTLRERVHSHGWDEDWVEEVIDKKRGQMTSTLEGQLTSRLIQNPGMQRTIIDTTRLYEVIHAYRKQSDEVGVPGIFYTVYHTGMTNKDGRRKDPYSYAYHGLLNYDHGEYPFVLFENETRSRVVDDARGYGEVMATWQDGVKAEIDSRRDRASISTMPPSFYPPGMQPERWGPGVQVPTQRSEAYGFFKIPQWDPGSRETEQTLRMIADRWAGRALPDQSNAMQATAMTQDRADQWMESHAEVDTQILQLMQQFMPDQFYFRVVGSEKGRSIHTTRDEIQGEFDVRIAYNIGDMIPEVTKQKLMLMKEVISLDRAGRVDSGEAVQVAFEMLDPNLGERLIRPAQAAYEAEVQDEANTFAQINAGVPVDVKPGNAQNYELRLQWLKQMLSQNQEAAKRYKEDPYFRDLLDKRIKQLEFQVQQYSQNALIGRLGA